MTSHVYEVIVRGRMSQELMASLDGFAIDTGDDGLTRLVGDVPDQPQLLGLLAGFRRPPHRGRLGEPGHRRHRSRRDRLISADDHPPAARRNRTTKEIITCL